MTHLPSGIVTFLFTDIEGSTRLWERDADVMWAALRQHNAILDNAIASHHGFHFKTIGDAFQAAFANPVEALHACVDAQKGFATTEWGETGPLRVRMALHLGPAEPSNGDYLAPCLNRLSRLLSTGYGAQVLLSDAIRQHVEGHLPGGVTLRDLGTHRLRDLLEPERVAQLVIDGVPDTFPPLKSLEQHPTNLPIQPNPLVGRDRELARITSLLTQGDDRLVTLTGIGGTGKTRLALQAGAEMGESFFDGVFFIDLAAITDHELVIPTISATIGIRESGGLSLDDALVAWLQGKTMLLIVDNVEHVLEAAPDLAQLLERCNGIRILATSRTRLNLRAERELRVEPLEAPRGNLPLEAIARNDAVSLFVQRARAVASDFDLDEENAATVSAICGRLDGIPLAIELAAARIKALTPQSLLQRLDRRLEVLTSGAQDLPARQRTLRATIEWSHDLLPREIRKFFDRLSVFNGGFDVDAAAAVAGPISSDTLDVLTFLLDRSLIRRAPDPDADPRFTMLETLREFGLDELRQSGQDNDTRDAHARWYRQLAATARKEITGPNQATWLARLELEHDNLRSALAWTNTAERLDGHLGLVESLERFWIVRGHFTEGRRWVDDALAAASAQGSSPLLLANGAGNFAFAQGDFEAARERYQNALVAARAAGDREMEASILNNLGNVTLRLSEPGPAAEWYEQSLRLSTELGDDFRRAITLGNLGTIAHYRSDVNEALSRYAECLGLWRQLGNAQGEVPMLLNLLLLLAPQPAYSARARAYGDQCIELARKLGDRWNEALAIMGLGQIEDANGNLDAALGYFRQSLAVLREIGASDGIASNLGYIGVVSIDQGEVSQGAAILLDKLTDDQEHHDPDGVQFCLEGLAVAALARQEPRLAAIALGAAEQVRESISYPLPLTCQLRHARCQAQLRDALGEDLTTFWAEGRDRPLDAVVADLRAALSPDPRPASTDPREQLLADLDALLGIPHEHPAGA